MSRSSLCSSTQTRESASPVAAARAGTADMVNVIFRHVRQLVVHHVRQLFNVEATGSDVGRHQRTRISPDLKSASARVRAWLLLPWNGGAADAVFIQLFRQVVCAVLGAGKDQHLLPVALTDHLGEQFRCAFIHKVDVLRHLLRGGVAARDFHFQRVMQQLSASALIRRRRRSRRRAGSDDARAAASTRRMS